jgi:hypothetical protein
MYTVCMRYTQALITIKGLSLLLFSFVKSTEDGMRRYLRRTVDALAQTDDEGRD